MPSLVNEWFYLSSARFLLVKTVQYSSQRRGTPNLHLLSHPLTLRRCNLSNESNCIVCRDAPLEFLNLPWCPSPVTGVVPSLTQTFPRQELQCPMTNEIRPLVWGLQNKAWISVVIPVMIFGLQPQVFQQSDINRSVNNILISSDFLYTQFSLHE